MQHFHTLLLSRQKGEVDDETTKKMNQPRCRLGDPVYKFVKKYGKRYGLKVSVSRKKRFILQGTNWDQTFDRKGNVRVF